MNRRALTSHGCDFDGEIPIATQFRVAVVVFDDLLKKLTSLFFA